MVPDRQKVRTDGRTDGMDGRTHGRRQNYIPPTSSGDNKTVLIQESRQNISSYVVVRSITFNLILQHGHILKKLIFHQRLSQSCDLDLGS